MYKHFTPPIFSALGKHLFKISMLIVLLVAHNACRKDSAITAPDELAALKSFYEQHKPSASSIFKNTTPNWSKIATVETDGFTVYEVALNNPDRVGLMSARPSPVCPDPCAETAAVQQ